MKPISLQLYTVREAAAQDFPGVLRRVAQIGYKGVETGGLHGHKPEEIAAVIRGLGLEVMGSHTVLPTKENVQQILDAELPLGNKRVIGNFRPDLFKTADQCKAMAEKLNVAAELVRPYGLSVGIHNHWWEFSTLDGRWVYDILMEETRDVFGELDVYWAAYGKVDPAEVTRRYKSRMPLLHIKDGTLEENAPHTAVGAGVLDMPAIIGAADPNVLEWLVVELDRCATDVFEAVEQSYQYLTSTGLAEGNK